MVSNSSLACQVFIEYNNSVPGSSDKYLKSSQQAGADCFIYDLEDSVSINEKINSRSRILKHLKSVDNTSNEVAVRINTLDSGFGKDDLTIMVIIT